MKPQVLFRSYMFCSIAPKECFLMGALRCLELCEHPLTNLSVSELPQHEVQFQQSK